jgi:hypothetical protein
MDATWFLTHSGGRVVLGVSGALLAALLLVAAWRLAVASLRLARGERKPSRAWLAALGCGVAVACASVLLPGLPLLGSVFDSVVLLGTGWTLERPGWGWYRFAWSGLLGVVLLEAGAYVLLGLRQLRDAR